MKVTFFNNEIEKFISSLEKSSIARVLRTIDLFEMFGNELGSPHTKKIEPRLFELRIRGKQEIRIFYTFSSGAAVLLHGFMKKAQCIPKKEIEIARTRKEALDFI